MSQPKLQLHGRRTTKVEERFDSKRISYLYNMSKTDFKLALLKKSPSKIYSEGDLLDEYNKCKSKWKDMLKTGGRRSCTYVSNKGARFFCNNSIQGLPGIFKGFLLKGIATDIDIKNCHCKLLAYICKERNIDVPLLDYYNQNRDQVIQQNMNKNNKCISEAKASVKKTIISIMYGNDNEMGNGWLGAFQKECVEKLHNTLNKLEEFESLVELSEESRGKVSDSDDSGFEGSVSYRIAEQMEVEIIYKIVMPFLKKKKLEVGIVMHDGLIVYSDLYSNKKLLKEIEVEVEKKYPGLGLEFAYKEHDDFIQMEEGFVEPRIWDFEDMKECREFLLSHKNKVCHSNGVIWAKHNSGIWTCVRSECISIVYSLIGDMLKLPCERMVNIIENDMEFYKNDMLSETVTSTKGYLSFLNGVMDLKNNMFLPYDHESLKEVYFSSKIGYDYEDPSPEALQFVKDHVINTIFHCDGMNTDAEKLKACEETRDGFFWYCSQFLGGNLMKLFLFCDGDRNCGKGLLTNYFRKSFAAFTGIFDIANIMNTKSLKDDRKTWMVPFVESRLVFSNETDITSGKLSGKELKSIASGGDEVVIRKMTLNSKAYQLTAGMVSFQQELAGIDDGLAYDTMVHLTFPCTFSENGKAVKDGFAVPRARSDAVKDAVKNGFGNISAKEIKCAFVKIVMDYYNANTSIEILKNSALKIKQNADGSSPSDVLRDNFMLSSLVEEYISSVNKKEGKTGGDALECENVFIQSSELVNILKKLGVHSIGTDGVAKHAKAVFGISPVQTTRPNLGRVRGYWLTQISYDKLGNTIDIDGMIVKGVETEDGVKNDLVADGNGKVCMFDEVN